MRLFLPSLMFVFLHLSGCSDESKESSPQTQVKSDQEDSMNYQVLDLFNVGKDIFVRALKADPAANSMWVGTSSGVHEIALEDNQIKRTFTRKDGLANEYVFAVGIDKDGYKWFGTNAGGASRYKDGEWKTYFPMHGLADYWIYSFANQNDGTVWIGTWAGANSFNPETGEMKTYLRELVNEWVYGLLVDKQDRVWFGTEGGLTMFDGDKWYSWAEMDNLKNPEINKLQPSRNTGLGTRSRHDLGVLSGGQATFNPNYVFDMVMTDDLQLWAGTWGGGVVRFDTENERWRSYTKEDGLAGNIVYSTLLDSKGDLWFGTDNGLSRFDGKGWQTFDHRHGLPDSNIYDLAEAPNGDIWAGTRGAVIRIGQKGTE